HCGRLQQSGLSYQRPDGGEHLETPWASSRPRAQKDHDLARIHPSPHGYANGHGLFHQCGVELVEAADLFLTLFPPLRSSPSPCSGGEAPSVYAGDARAPSARFRFERLWAKMEIQDHETLTGHAMERGCPG